MPSMISLVDGTIPVAADFNANYLRLNQVAGVGTAITGYVKGDTLYASAQNTLSALPIGATGAVPVVVGGVPTWSLMPAFAVYLAGNQAIASNTETKIAYDTTEFDPQAGWTVSTARWTVPAGQGGIYHFGASAGFTTVGDGTVFRLTLYQNGSALRRLVELTGSTPFVPTVAGSTLVSAAAGAYFEVFAVQNNGTQAITGGQQFTTFWGYRVAGQ